MKTDVRDVYSWSNRHAERLDGAIEVLVIESIFIVPDAGAGFELCKPMNQIPSFPGSGSFRFTVAPVQAMIAGCSRTVAPRRLKVKVGRSASYVVLLVRGIVIHVALARMTLAPGVFVRDDVLRFGKIHSSRVLST